MGQIAVFAKLTAKAGRRDALLDALQPMIECALHEEPSTIAYAVHTAPDADDVVWLYEVFADRAGLQAHADNEGRLADVGEAVSELLARPIELTWGRPLHRKGFTEPGGAAGGQHTASPSGGDDAVAAEAAT